MRQDVWAGTRQIVLARESKRLGQQGSGPTPVICCRSGSRDRFPDDRSHISELAINRDGLIAEIAGFLMRSKLTREHARR
jgi:hypothetical protein